MVVAAGFLGIDVRHWIFAQRTMDLGKFDNIERLCYADSRDTTGQAKAAIAWNGSTTSEERARIRHGRSPDPGIEPKKKDPDVRDHHGHQIWSCLVLVPGRWEITVSRHNKHRPAKGGGENASRSDGARSGAKDAPWDVKV